MDPRHRVSFGRGLRPKVHATAVGLWTPRELARGFPGFAVSRLAGQGILRPVDDSGRAVRNDRRDRWERALSALPLARGLGTFYALEMIRQPSRGFGSCNSCNSL